MTENPRNIGRVCDKCAKERLQPNPMYRQVPLYGFIGNFCKLAFPAPDGRQEYMWVEVTGKAQTEGEELRGHLNNDPVIATEFKDGDIIEFSRSEIIDVC